MVKTATLERRRRDLGMSYESLASRSGVSVATLKRMLSAGIEHANFRNVAAVAEALGLGLELKEEMSSHDMRERQAQKKAGALVSVVQSSSGLEAQAVDESYRKEMISQTVHELMARPKARLWDE